MNKNVLKRLRVVLAIKEPEMGMRPESGNEV